MNKDHNKLVVLTGPSGFLNKTEIILNILNKDPQKFKKITSYTDRPPETNETDDIDFHFISEEEFNEMIEKEMFLEWQLVLANNHRFGKTKEEVEKTLAESTNSVVFTIVNVINLPVFTRNYPHAKSIFIDVKDNLTLIRKLKETPSITTDEEFNRRYEYATEERRRRHLADIIINVDPDKDNIPEIITDIVDNKI